MRPSRQRNIVVTLADKGQKGKGLRREMKRWYRNMNPEKAQEIRRLYFKERKKQQEIAEQFGIAQSSVSRIISDMVWI